MFVVLTGLLWRTARGLLRSSSAKKWPIAEGRVESFYITTYKSKWGIFYFLVLQYSYVVGTERYSGSVTSGTQYSDRDSADDAGRAWVGAKIQIRYKQSHPATSAWLTQDGAPETTPFTAAGIDDGIIDPELNK